MSKHDDVHRALEDTWLVTLAMNSHSRPMEKLEPDLAGTSEADA